MKQESGEIPVLSRHKGQQLLSFILKKAVNAHAKYNCTFLRGDVSENFLGLLKSGCKVCLTFIKLLANFKSPLLESLKGAFFAMVATAEKKRIQIYSKDAKIMQQFCSTVATKKCILLPYPSINICFGNNRRKSGVYMI
jgi:hypothetical protein